eukprot:COSAG02_NODE_3083_length_7406_cov_3.325578_4_plen_110_part_00
MRFGRGRAFRVVVAIGRYCCGRLAKSSTAQTFWRQVGSTTAEGVEGVEGVEEGYEKVAVANEDEGGFRQAHGSRQETLPHEQVMAIDIELYHVALRNSSTSGDQTSSYS